MKIPGATISHQIIREQCRQNRGAAGAFEEAVRRVRETYNACIARGVSSDTELHLALVVQADRHRTDPADPEVSHQHCLANEPHQGSVNVDQTWRKSLFIGWRKQSDAITQGEYWLRWTSPKGLYYWLHPIEGRWVGEPEQLEMPTFPTYQKAYEASRYCERPRESDDAPCPRCNGTGEGDNSPNLNCPKCEGSGLARSEGA